MARRQSAGKQRKETMKSNPRRINIAARSKPATFSVPVKVLQPHPPMKPTFRFHMGARSNRLRLAAFEWTQEKPRFNNQEQH